MKEKDILIQKIKDYYKSINRNQTPPFETYSLSELRKCVLLFKI